MNPFQDAFSTLLPEIYWSRLGAPLRAIFPKRQPPASDKAHWNHEVSGARAARLGGTPSVDLRNEMIGTLLRHKAGELASVLDVGCAGGTLFPVLQRLGCSRYVGVDISEVAVAQAAATHRDTEASFVEGTVQSYKAHSSFDVVVLSEVLYYVDFEDIVQHVFRYFGYLNPGGILCISLNLRNPKGRAIHRTLKRHLRYVSGFIYQEKTELDGEVRRNRQRPLFHTFLALPQA